MLTKSILAGAAIALAATTGAASAGDPASALDGSAAAGPALAMPGPFSVLAGVPATPMGALELSVTRGAFSLNTPRTTNNHPRPEFFRLTGTDCVMVGFGGPPIGACV